MPTRVMSIPNKTFNMIKYKIIKNNCNKNSNCSF